MASNGKWAGRLPEKNAAARDNRGGLGGLLGKGNVSSPLLEPRAISGKHRRGEFHTPSASALPLDAMEARHG